MAERVIVYPHIPKCAGVTLSSIMRLNFRRSRTLHPHTFDKPVADEMLSFTAESREQATFVWGHFHYGVHLYLGGRPTYVTVLRDPVQRVASLYGFILREPSHPLHERLNAGVSLEEYVSSGMDGDMTPNGQTRQVSGQQYGEMGPSALESAKRNLNAFAVVGITERFDETFVLVRRRLGLVMPFYVTRNVTRTERIVSEEAEQMIRERNQMDLSLYAHAEEVFARQIAAEGPSFGREVARLRRLNPAVSALGRRVEPALARVGKTLTGF